MAGTAPQVHYKIPCLSQQHNRCSHFLPTPLKWECPASGSFGGSGPTCLGTIGLESLALSALWPRVRSLRMKSKRRVLQIATIRMPHYKRRAHLLRCYNTGVSPGRVAGGGGGPTCRHPCTPASKQKKSSTTENKSFLLNMLHICLIYKTQCLSLTPAL